MKPGAKFFCKNKLQTCGDEGVIFTKHCMDKKNKGANT